MESEIKSKSELQVIHFSDLNSEEKKEYLKKYHAKEDPKVFEETPQMETNPQTEMNTLLSRIADLEKRLEIILSR
jgi:hypothetical protein